MQIFAFYFFSILRAFTQSPSHKINQIFTREKMYILNYFLPEFPVEKLDKF